MNNTYSFYCRHSGLITWTKLLTRSAADQISRKCSKKTLSWHFIVFVVPVFLHSIGWKVRESGMERELPFLEECHGHSIHWDLEFTHRTQNIPKQTLITLVCRCPNGLLPILFFVLFSSHCCAYVFCSLSVVVVVI